MILNISAHVTDEEYVSIGFSEDSKMGGDDVIALYRDFPFDTFVASSLINPHGKILS